MYLQQMYGKVTKLLERIDFSKLWKDFKPIKFALYNDKECFYNHEYIEKTNEFIGNTAINYQGAVIAIWKLDDEVDEIILTSKIVHEMFHGFQMMNNESRFPHELDALYDYRYLDGNLSIKLAENKIIEQLLTNFDNDDFLKFLGLRLYRLNKFKN